MEDHKLAVPLCTLEVASTGLSRKGPSGSVEQQQQENTATATASADCPGSDLHSSRSLPAASTADLKAEGCSRPRRDASSLVSTRRNSSVLQDGIPPSTSPDGSYISSPFFSGSPMEFAETLQPRVLHAAADVQCSLSTPLEKFFDALDSTDIPVGTPSPLATVCTHHTTSPAGEAFPLNGPGVQEGEDADKLRLTSRLARTSTAETTNSSSVFPLRQAETSPEKEPEGQQSFPSTAAGRCCSSSQGEKSRTTSSAATSDSGLLESSSCAELPQQPRAPECALNQAEKVLDRKDGSNRTGAREELAASDADRLLVDFQLLLILLFDQVCNVVPGLRRQDGGAFYYMHLQRIAAGPLHPTLASYADVLLPICSSMNFFSSSNSSSGDQRTCKQDEQESILSVALRHLARHGTVPAAPIAQMVAKCPAVVFMQVVSALECMYSLQRILTPGAPDPPPKVSEELDPKTIWGDAVAVAEMHKTANFSAEDCVSSSVHPKCPSEDAGSNPSSPHPPVLPSRPTKRARAAADLLATRKQKPTVTPAAMPETECESRGVASNASFADSAAADLMVAAAAGPPRIAQEAGEIASDSRVKSSPTFIPASVNKRRHPNVQAEILSSCCPESLAQRGTRLLGEVLQKLQCEQAMRQPVGKTHSPKQVFSGPVDQPEGAMRQRDAACSAAVAEGESDSVSSGSARGKRNMSMVGEQSLGEALTQFAAVQQAARSSVSTVAAADTEELQSDAAAAPAADCQLKKHGYGLRRGNAKRGRKAVDEGLPRNRTRLTPVKGPNPQQSRGRAAAPLSPSETLQQEPNHALPPSLTEQLMKLASGAEGDFPAALSSTMRGVFFNRSLNRWVCTWSRNGKEYQRSWSAGKYGYETARGLAMHCRLEKLLSGEAHTLQKGMLAVFKPVINPQVSPAAVEAGNSATKPENSAADDAERRKPELLRARCAPRAAPRLDSASGEAEGDMGVVKPEGVQESAAGSRLQQTTGSRSTYSDMLTLMNQAISRKPGGCTAEAETNDAATKNADSRGGEALSDLVDPSVGEHFLAAVAAAAAACDVPGFED
ncbi:hypothetical protein, conserved [Eimeria necatrix]|uniref:AP2/ERF domain-containing protein n=1 Tax=Eimeria necatrix TaxID=51315 RepID=U6MGE6_9EIME|nr:hypothetical protein, conserved [Eimeria necatrix]CDJ63332.1 hypothetical protein, conserved [Eimeria necatrix]